MAKIIQTTQSRFTRVFAQFGINHDRPGLRPCEGSRGNGARWYDCDANARGL